MQLHVLEYTAVNRPAQSILWHNQPCGTVNTPAGSTSWQSTGWHNQHSVGTINTSAPSSVQPSQHSGTITSLAQSSFQHSPTSVAWPVCSTWRAHSKSLSLHCVHFSSSPATSNPSAGVCIWTTHWRQFLLKVDATRVSFSSFSVSTVGSILMHVDRPQE